MHQDDVNALTEHFHQELSIKEEALRNLRMVVENANAFQQNGLVESLQEKISDIEAKYKNFEVNNFFQSKTTN
jgi:imidazole glycerol phosphate synthase subunit HisF